MSKFIVKVQLSLESSNGKQSTLIYDKDRKMRFEEEVKPDVKALMKGEFKKFFYVEKDGKGGLNFLEEAPWQTW